MIGKALSVPSRLDTFEALLRRLPSHHVKREQIAKAHAMQLAGYRGEKDVYYRLKTLQDDFLIFHDLRILLDHAFFQIDFLILTAKCVFIIEVKNIKGTLFFDTTFNQLIRTLEEKEEGFRDPLAQVHEHKEKLEAWFSRQKIPCVPIESFVAISNTSSILKTNATDQGIYREVVHAAYLLNHIYDRFDFHQANSQSILATDQVASALLKANMPFKNDILATYQIPSTELHQGVICENCGTVQLKRTYGKWHCSSCQVSSTNGHVRALHDYLCLIAPTINNSQCRHYLGLDSAQLTQRILRDTLTVAAGNTKNRTYRAND